MLFVMILSSCAKHNIKGGELVVEYGSSEINLVCCNFDTINPIKTEQKATAELLAFVYEPLFELDKSLKPVGALAKQYRVGSDYSEAIITLNDKAWQDGEKVTADDVVYTINSIKREASPLYAENVKNVASAEALSEKEVLLKLSKPTMNICGLLTFPIIKNGQLESVSETTNGTGAFTLSEKTSSKLIFSATDSKASAKKINVSIVRSSNVCKNMFETGEADALTVNNIDLKTQTPGGKIKNSEYTSNRMVFLGFNCTCTKFYEPYFRLAIAESLNRDDIIKNAYYSKGVPAKYPINPSSWLYGEVQGPQIDFDGVMKSAGYDKIGGVYQNNNGLAEFSILVPSESQEKIKAAKLISENLKSKGVTAYVEEVDFDIYISRINEKDYEAFVGEMTMADNFGVDFITQDGNYFGYANPELITACENMNLTSNDETLKSTLTEYERIFELNPPLAPILYEKDAAVFSQNISGEGTPNFKNNYVNIKNWYRRANGKED